MRVTDSKKCAQNYNQALINLRPKLAYWEENLLESTYSEVGSLDLTDPIQLWYVIQQMNSCISIKGFFFLLLGLDTMFN